MNDHIAFPSFRHEDNNPDCPCNECIHAALVACDWCGAVHPLALMEPEEGDEWICRKCHERDLKIHGPIGVREPNP